MLEKTARGNATRCVSHGFSEIFLDGSELTVREVQKNREMTWMACIGASESGFSCRVFAISG